MERHRLVAAGNTMAPAVLVLERLGFAVSRDTGAAEGLEWRAVNSSLEVRGDDPVQLLGLVVLYQQRGSEWRASDDEIQAFIAKHHPEQGR